MGTPTPTFAGAPAGVTFDSSPATQATANTNTNAPVQQAQTFAGAPAGVTFDTPSSNQSVPATQDQSAPQSTSQIAPTGTISAAPGSMPNDPMAAKVALWSQNVQSDLKNGTAITPVGKFLKALGAHGFDVGNSPEVGEFMGSLPLGLLKAIQGRAEMVQPGQRWQGVKDTTGGLLDAATIPSAFVAPEAGEVAGDVINSTPGAIEKAGNATVDAIANQAGRAVKAVKAPFKPGTPPAERIAGELPTQWTPDAIQADLQGTLRDVLQSVAKDAGVDVPDTASIRDTAQATADAVKAKASGLYKQLDNALGGTRFQTFDEQLSNVKRALRNSTGIDPDADGKLIERVNSIQDAKDAAIAQIKQKGIDPSIVKQADALWKQGSALEDLNDHVQAVTKGMRPELAADSTQTTPEKVSLDSIFTRLNKLNNTGRLQSAVGGEANAKKLLQAVDTAHLTTQKAATWAADEAEQAKGAVSDAADWAKNDAARVKKNLTKLKVAGAASATLGIPSVREMLSHLL